MSVRILVGDALTRLRDLDDESVHTVVTSPPYWALRAYKGDPGMIGLEPTFEEHLDNLMAVFGEVRRVLRRDGTLYLNYGDAYAGSKGGAPGSDKQASNRGSVSYAGNFDFGLLKTKDLMMMPARVAMALQAEGWWLRSEIVWNKPNAFPESVTDRPTCAHEKIFLLSRSGSPLFWSHRDGLAGTRSKPEPDYRWLNRRTYEETATEPDGWRGLLFTDRDGRRKRVWRRINAWRGHDYFYDAEAVKSTAKESTIQRLSQPSFGDQTGGPKDPKDGNRSHRRVLEKPHRRSDKQADMGHRHAGFNDRWDAMSESEKRELGANLRNDWTLPTISYTGTHFATFPVALVEPCVKAGTSEKGCCSACGAPYSRVVRKSGGSTGAGWHDHAADLERGQRCDSRFATAYEDGSYKVESLGWSPTCGCDAEPAACVVLDPFGGAGTVGLVADRLQRDAVLVEISPDYAELARDRIHGDAPMFTDVELLP